VLSATQFAFLCDPTPAGEAVDKYLALGTSDQVGIIWENGPESSVNEILYHRTNCPELLHFSGKAGGAK